MRSVEAYREQIVSAARAGVVAASLLAAGCSVEATPLPPEATSLQETTTTEVDYCADYAQTDSLVPFDGSGFATEDEFVMPRDIIGQLEAINPEATPQEFANLYIQTYGPGLVEQGVQVVFDETMGYTAWEEGQTDYGTSNKQIQQSRVINIIEPIIETLQDYPVGMLPALEVNTVRLSQESEDLVGGRYKHSLGEIQVEYNDDKPLTQRQLHETIAHEIGHAIQAHYCYEYVDYDGQLGDGIDFVETPISLDTLEEVEQFAALVPAEQLAYGKDRAFPSFYAASGVSEYFAEIVSFTLEERGLILPGDADYGSPLQEKQTLVVGRLEGLFPGITDFLEVQTQVLRMNPELEIYDTAPVVRLTQMEMDQALAGLGDGERLVIDGVMADYWSSGRGADISAYPQIASLPDGLSLRVSGGDGSGMSYGLRLPMEQDGQVSPEVSFIFYSENPDNPLAIESATKASSSPVSVRQKLWAGDRLVKPVLDEIATGQLKPVKIVFELTPQ